MFLVRTGMGQYDAYAGSIASAARLRGARATVAMCADASVCAAAGGSCALRDGMTACKADRADRCPGCTTLCWLDAGRSWCDREGTCGNGTVERGEECDDGNVDTDDGCNAHCLLERGRCGDGQVQRLLGEECERSAQNPASPLRCDRHCRFVALACGNGTLDPGEECDDGNTADRDGCDRACRTKRYRDDEGSIGGVFRQPLKPSGPFVPPYATTRSAASSRR